MNPRPPGSEKLSGEEKYRVRQGDYRILDLIEDASSTVTVVKIGHRREFTGPERGLGNDSSHRLQIRS